MGMVSLKLTEHWRGFWKVGSGMGLELPRMVTGKELVVTTCLNLKHKEED